MTRENAKALLPIIKAYAEGKVIQIINPSGEWIDNNEPLFNCDYSFYRIKQKVKFRHFANAEECWQELLKHKPFGWVKDTESNEYLNVYCISNSASSIDLFCRMFKRCIFIDGSPFGVKV